MTFCNLTYIQTDKFTEFLREIFSVSANGMQLQVSCKISLNLKNLKI